MTYEKTRHVEVYFKTTLSIEITFSFTKKETSLIKFIVKNEIEMCLKYDSINIIYTCALLQYAYVGSV